MRWEIHRIFFSRCLCDDAVEKANINDFRSLAEMEIIYGEHFRCDDDKVFQYSSEKSSPREL